MIKAALLQELGNGRTEPEIKSLAAELSRRGIHFRLFPEKHLRRGQIELAPDVLVAGHIPVVLSALRQMGIEPPAPNDYPESLRPWLHRRIWRSTVKDVVAQLHVGEVRPFFAKPVSRHKRFRGQVFESWDDLRALGGASDHTQVVCSEVVRWVSEYRVYVVRSKIVGIRHYRGDSQAHLDQEQVEQAVARYETSGEATAGYGIDFGLLSTGETALVEVNDGYSLGSYGLDDLAYADLIIVRWTELTENSRRGA